MIIGDAETNGLLTQCTKMWVLTLYDTDTKVFTSYLHPSLRTHSGAVPVFSGHVLKFDNSWMQALDNTDFFVGHNIEGFDIVMFEKLFNFKIKCRTRDTLIMSQVLDYKRFGNEGHSMEVWGKNLGRLKQEHEDWDNFSYEMLTRNVSDVQLNILIHDQLVIEFDKLRAKYPYIVPYLKSEQYVARWSAKAEYIGWPFDVDKAFALYDKLEAEMQKAYDALSSKLGTKAVIVDRVPKENAEKVAELKMRMTELARVFNQKPLTDKEFALLGAVVKYPKWTKQGYYDVHTSNWFKVDPCSGYEGEIRTIEGAFCRVEFKKLSLDSTDDVKLFLTRLGWVPDEWNYRKDPDGTRRKTSAKVTETSLEFLGGDGKLYLDFLTTKSRHAVLKTWLENIDDNGRLHGGCFTIGTPSMRARHSLIVNIPSADAVWGKEMRELFTCKPGWKLIGCDSAGNQARGLAHFLRNPEFTETLLNGDIHQYNADAATNALKEMEIDHEVIRSIAKRLLYAFLFGASGSKLWGYIFGTQNAKLGNEFKDKFTEAVPGFKDLIEKLKKMYKANKGKNGESYIRGIAGNKIYVDSPHKLLVYLLQSTEKATCSAAIMLTMLNLERAGIPYEPCIFMHDEEDFAVPEQYAEQAAAIGKQAFIDGPKKFGVEIMDGDAKIGDNWYEIH